MGLSPRISNLGFGACPEALRGSVRLYDPTYGRFLSVDPLWGKYLPYSAYQYCRNNPINLIDDSGLGDEPIRERPVATTAQGQAAAMILAATPVTFNGNDPTGPSDAYNCHSLAWTDGAGDPSDPSNASIVGVLPRWDEDPMNNAAQCTELPFEASNKIGDRLVYFNEDADLKTGIPTGEAVATHSAIVVRVDECGNADLVISKWGQGPGFLHHPRDVPTGSTKNTGYNGTTEPQQQTSAGGTYVGRKYYRCEEPAQGQSR